LELHHALHTSLPSAAEVYVQRARDIGQHDGAASPEHDPARAGRVGEELLDLSAQPSLVQIEALDLA